MPTKIRLGCKIMAMANTLAYYDMATIPVVKSFIVQVPVVSACNTFIPYVTDDVSK